MVTELTVWEQDVFTVLASNTATAADINAVLAESPATVSEAVHSIVSASAEVAHGMPAEDLAVEFKNATQVPDSRNILHEVVWSLDAQTWSAEAEVFNKHLALADAITDDEALRNYQGFLMFVWDQILSEIRERIEGQASEDIDFEKFTYLVDHIEELANM